MNVSAIGANTWTKDLWTSGPSKDILSIELLIVIQNYSRLSMV